MSCDASKFAETAFHKFSKWSLKLRPFLDLLNFIIREGKKTSFLDSDVTMKCPKTPPSQKLEIGNSNFRSQRTRVGKNSYFTKNHTKMPVDVTVWCPV